jgi:hypothetical protein
MILPFENEPEGVVCRSIVTQLARAGFRVLKKLKQFPSAGEKTTLPSLSSLFPLAWTDSPTRRRTFFLSQTFC